MSKARFVVGIDLGTTHCAMAASPVDHPEVQLFEIPQLIAPGELISRPLLPSFLYLPSEAEFMEHHLKLPWGLVEYPVGELARKRGARVPGRLVASSKSWICHGGVDRRAPILPWDAPDELPHLSPYEASARLLEHLRAAWDEAHPEAVLADQDLVITVPASFDSVARALTVEAAELAGLPRIKLIEEPQAAFYDFLGHQEEELREVLGDARLILVVDIGGGTTDLTLIQAEELEGEPRLTRIAVGGHLMLGGDNMDAALARLLQNKAGIKRLDPTEWAALIQSARQAKELLLSEEAPEKTRVSIQRRGARLLGGTRSVHLQREELREAILEGFLPFSDLQEVSSRRGRSGLTTLGLPYTTDPAIPRHISTFLRRHAEDSAEAGAQLHEGLPRPDLILLNGGVFQSPAIVSRLKEVFQRWFGQEIPLLQHQALDTAVARGAVRYGLSQRGFGRSIGGGAARAYYVGVDSEAGGVQAFCIAPKGMDEGSSVEVSEQIFELLLNRPVAFPLYSYTGAKSHAPGELIHVDRELEQLPALEITLRPQPGMGESPEVLVKPSATLTERGTLDLFLSTIALPPRRWKLELSLKARPEPEEEELPSEEEPLNQEPLPKNFQEARRLVDRTFTGRGEWAEPQRGKALRRDLEKILGPRGAWTSRVCRTLWKAFMLHKAHRDRSPLHERAWISLSGWCLRPGFGASGDRERLQNMWDLYEEGLQFPKDKGNWREWWILWRRVAAGLNRDQQQELFEDLRPWLDPKIRRFPTPRAHGPAEMLRLLAALERLSPEQKQEAGEWFFLRFKKIRSWWPLGRLGARQPFQGNIKDTVTPELAELWLGKLLEADWAREDGASFAAVLLTRMTKDLRRDIGAELREEVIERLREVKAPTAWIKMVAEGSELSAKDTKRLFGDALPSGLRLS